MRSRLALLVLSRTLVTVLMGAATLPIATIALPAQAPAAHPRTSGPPVPDAVQQPDEKPAPEKRSRLSRFARGATARVGSVVTKAEEKTGVSRTTVAKAALAASGVGAAALLIRTDSGGAPAGADTLRDRPTSAGGQIARERTASSERVVSAKPATRKRGMPAARARAKGGAPTLTRDTTRGRATATRGAGRPVDPRATKRTPPPCPATRRGCSSAAP